MKKILLSISLIFSFAGYAEYRYNQHLLIKNSEMASSQTIEPTQSAKAENLPSGTTEEIPKDVPKPQPAITSDDENYDYENEGGDDSEGERGNTRRVQTVSSRTSLPKTATSQKSSAQPAPMPMINTGGNMMMDKGQYKNGEFIGNIADAYYGNVQVKAVISGGKITDVQFLDYPHDRQNSIRINTYAMPILKSEAIKAQNAEVDVVSGASATSEAFKESLSSALAQAKI